MHLAMLRQMREFATFNNLVLTNIVGPHKPSRRTLQSPDRKHHNQIDYILVKKHFRSGGVNIHRTRSFPGADIGSDHDLVIMTF